MKRAMDLFGKALRDYKKGGDVDFYFIDNEGNTHSHDISRYFRPPEKLSKLEKLLSSMVKGKVLDIGSCTANYFPAFKSQDITGIEISELLVKLANEEGFNCICSNIYDYNPGDKYDTITILENNLGMGGSIPKLKQLLKKLDSLLENKGCILIMQKRVNFKYATVELRPKYNNVIGKKFKWLNIKTSYLKKICNAIGLNLEIIAKDKNYNLLKITKY